jgi:hypothetical protein
LRWGNLIKVSILLACVSIISVLLIDLFNEYRTPPKSGTAIAVGLPSPSATSAPKLLLPWPAKGALRVMYAGEDLTHGLYTSNPSLDFTAQTTAAIAESGNVDATTVGQPNEALKNMRNEPLPSGLGLIIVEFGTTEAHADSLETFSSDYAAFLDKLKSASPGAGLVCLGTWTYSTIGGPFDAAIRQACEQRDGIYLKLSDLYTAEGAPYRASTGTPWSGGKVPDSTHANDAGHKAVADKIIAALLSS